MADPTMHDILDQLATQRDQLATMHATMQQQGATLALYERRGQRRRTVQRLLPLLLVTLLVALLPFSLLAANPTFSDMNDAADVHRPNIQAIGNAGITTGFDDPNNPNTRLYNPKGLVTREEMASFLARTAGLGGNAPVVNAKTAQTATLADNAAVVQGRAANQFSRVARRIVANNIGATPAQPPITVTALYPLFQTVATVAIEAPTAGFLLVSASTVAETNNWQSIILRMRDTTSNESSPHVSQFQPGGFLNGTLATMYVFPVSAGTRTVVLEAATNDTSATPGDHDLQNTVLTALFVPFGYDGGTTLAP